MLEPITPEADNCSNNLHESNESQLKDSICNIHVLDSCSPSSTHGHRSFPIILLSSLLLNNTCFMHYFLLPGHLIAPEYYNVLGDIAHSLACSKLPSKEIMTVPYVSKNELVQLGHIQCVVNPCVQTDELSFADW